jgi:hypothetical protein
MGRKCRRHQLIPVLTPIIDLASIWRAYRLEATSNGDLDTGPCRGGDRPLRRFADGLSERSFPLTFSTDEVNITFTVIQ